MEQIISQWWSMATGYFAAPAQLAAGHVQLATLIPVAGMVLAIIGIVLAIRWREKRAVWLIPPAILTLMTPIVVSFGDTMMGPFGTFFTLFAGLVCLLIWIGVLAGDATRRLPIWLIGMGCLSFIGYFTLIVVLLTWG